MIFKQDDFQACHGGFTYYLLNMLAYFPVFGNFEQKSNSLNTIR